MNIDIGMIMNKVSCLFSELCIMGKPFIKELIPFLVIKRCQRHSKRIAAEPCIKCISSRNYYVDKRFAATEYMTRQIKRSLIQSVNDQNRRFLVGITKYRTLSKLHTDLVKRAFSEFA